MTRRDVSRRMLLALAIAVSAIRGAPAALGAAEPPWNFVIILVDDLGWNDLSCQGSAYYETPRIDRLAAEGVRFTNGYAACAVCSPSRVSLMTGMNAARHMVTNWTLRKDRQPDRPHPKVRAAAWNLNGLSPTPGVQRTVHAVTLPMLLKQAGYRTIHCGKAHFGAKDTPGADPLNLGFDVNIAGHAAGGRGEDGEFVEGSVNARVEAALRGFAETRRKFVMRQTEEGAST